MTVTISKKPLNMRLCWREQMVGSVQKEREATYISTPLLRVCSYSWNIQDLIEKNESVAVVPKLTFTLISSRWQWVALATDTSERSFCVSAASIRTDWSLLAFVNICSSRDSVLLHIWKYSSNGTKTKSEQNSKALYQYSDLLNLFVFIKYRQSM